MRNANGYGGVTKLSGNRRRPYMAYVSELKSKGISIPPADKTRLKTILERHRTKEIGDGEAFEGITAVLRLDAESILAGLVDDNTYKGYYKKKPIGYYTTQKEAMIALAEYNKSPVALDGITFAEVWNIIKGDDDKSEAVKKIHAKAFERCEPLWDLPLADIRLLHLQDVLDKYQEYSASVVGSVLAVMRLVFRYGLEHDIITKDYSQYAKAKTTASKRQKTAFSREEVDALWQSNDPFDKMLLVLIYSGMRIGELCSKPEIRDGCFWVAGTKTKAARRVIPVHDRIAPLVDDVYNYIGTTKPHIMTIRMARRNSPHTLHETRHSFATYSVKMNPAYRAFILGHSTTLTNDVYTHPEMIIDELKKEMAKFDLQ